MFNGASDKGNEKRNHVSFLWSVCAMLQRATPPRPFFVCLWLPLNFRFELSVETRCLRHGDAIVSNDYYNIFLLSFTDARFTRSCWSRSRNWSSDSSLLRVRGCSRFVIVISQLTVRLNLSLFQCHCAVPAAACQHHVTASNLNLMKTRRWEEITTHKALMPCRESEPRASEKLA